MTRPAAPIVHDDRRWSRALGASVPSPGTAARSGDGLPPPPEEPPGDPGPLLRIGTMIRWVLGEIGRAPLDDGARARVREGLPSDAELRVAEAQLVGWIEGVLQGAQVAVLGQQMAARRQLEQLRATRAGGAAPGARYL